MKALGMIMVFFSATAVGFVKANGYKDKEAELSAVIELIYFIKHEISAFLTPQHLIYKRFSNSVLEKNGFLPCLRHMSENGAEKPFYSALENSGLFKNESDILEVLTPFSLSLGTLSTRIECERCDRALGALEEIQKSKREESMQKIKLCKSIGSMIGIGLVLLLW